MKKTTEQLEIKSNIVMKQDAKRQKDPQKQQLLEYMQKSGVLIGMYTTRVFDSVTNKSTNQTIKCYEDGEFEWNDATIYYLDKYDIIMNDDFKNKVRLQFDN